MKILENISSGYKRIATGIAIVAFLSILYLALIPAGSVADVVSALSGTPIAGAIVKIAEYPQYNTTTAGDGTYLLDNVPYDNVTGSTYTVRVIIPGYGPNSTKVTLTEANPNPAVSFDLYPSDPMYMPFLYDKPTASGYESSIQIFNPYDFNITVDNPAIKSGVNKTIDYEIAPKKLKSIYLSEIWGSEVLGSAKTETTRPAKVQGIIKTISTGIYSIAPSANVSTDTVFYFPFLYDKPTASGYESGVQIFNPDTVNTIYANVSVIKSGVVQFNNFSIAPQTFGSRNARDVWGSEVLGTMKVETTGPAVAQGYIRTTASKTYSIAPAAKIPTVTTLYLPYLKTIGSSYDSGVQIFNPYNTVTINATITSYNMLNGVMNATSFDIAPNSFGSRTALQVAGGDFEGAFIVETKVDTTPTPALVQGYIRTSGTYTVAPAVQ